MFIILYGEKTLDSYCIFCRSGCEEKVTGIITKYTPEIQAYAPKRIMREKKRGKWTQRELALLPGYVFLFGEEIENIRSCLKGNDIYKVLQYDDGIRKLAGSDHEYAMWILSHSGKITPSKVFEDGDEIRVIDGPLGNCTGKIVRLDKRKRRAIVEFEFDGKKRKVSLSADCMDLRDKNDTKEDIG